MLVPPKRFRVAKSAAAYQPPRCEGRLIGCGECAGVGRTAKADLFAAASNRYTAGSPIKGVLVHNGSIRAMLENEISQAMRGDIYFRAVKILVAKDKILIANS